MSRDLQVNKVTTTAGAIAALVAAIVLAPPAAAQTYSQHLAVDCPQPYSQSCPPRQGITVKTDGPIAAQFIADPNPPACAPGYVQLFIGHVRVNEGTVNPGGTLRGATTVAQGTYEVKVQVDGILGGCNTGAMSGWSGTLNVQTNDDVPRD